MDIPMIPLLRPRPQYGNLESFPYKKTPNGQELHYVMPPPIIYHYTNMDSAKLIIENQTLKFSAPETFNDPFDMYSGLVDLIPSSYEKENWYKQMVTQGSRSQRKGIKNSMRSASMKKFIEAQEYGFNSMKKYSGVCCFSTKCNTQLMWSHYSYRHSGVCLGFDLDPISRHEGFNFFLKYVNYPKSIEPVNLYKNRDKATDYWLTTKSEPWAYEKEVRGLIVDRKGISFFKFERACLKEVYFGCKTKTEEIDKILKLLENKNYQIIVTKKMIIDNHIFDIKAIDI